MLAVSEQPETLEELEQTVQRWVGHSGKGKIPFTLDKKFSSGDLLCFISRRGTGLKLETTAHLIVLTFKQTSLKLILEKFLVSTAVEGEKVRINIEADPAPEHRFLEGALRRISETKHPAFQSRILRAFIDLEEDLSTTTIEQATGAPTDFLVALEALCSASGTTQLVNEDPLLAARMRGLKRKRQMLDAAGGILSSQQVADMLGITRQAVDKRRGSRQLLALTQGRRGYSYPRFQFEEGKTIAGLDKVLPQLKALDPWMQMVFFTSPHERLQGKTPIESLHQGLVDEVAQVAEHYGEQGAL